MAFIEPIPEEDAEGATAEMYAADLDEDGYVANSTKAFGHRPAVFAAWRQLGSTIGGSMDRRRYELATVAAARVLRSSYCSLGHGKVLAEQFLGAERTIALATGAVDALDPLDAEIVRFATLVTREPASVTASDMERLRALGLSDEEILDVVLAAAARCFFSTVLEALGVQADPAYRALDPELRAALTVGRPIQEG
ncbi:MAG TPA: carboxymuconolactone decarboxylase family protein [Actinomycetota bacterium]|nr:carboxymuconolactone decarboxylase family protein [Actinomycetota bacterium]